jgi:cytochrome c-type biogenesis protein CcmH/NrfG
MDVEARIEQLETLIAEDPEDADLYFLLGKALLDGKRPGDAAERLTEAVRRNPDHAAIRRFLGEALRDTGQRDEALARWREGIALAERTGDLQAGKEMAALLKKLERGGG